MKALAITVALVTLVSSAVAQSLKAQADKVNAEVGAAMMKKDFKALEKALRAGVTADFVYEEQGRKQDFKTMFEHMKMGLSSMPKITKAHAKTTDIKENGNKATAVSIHTIEAITIGEDKKEHKMVFVSTSADTLVKVGGKWKLSKMVLKSTKATMDGKPLPGM